MFDTSPFYDLLGFLTPTIMQTYIVLMFLAVVGGTIFDTIHKKSAKYFFENAQKAQRSARRTVTSGEKTSLAIATLTNEVLTSSEFCNPQRRMSHLLTMYGFIIFIVTTVTLIFGYPTPAAAAPGMLVFLWHLGALMVCVGGYWFWFSIRVDVNAEGKKWYEFCRADLFIVSLLMTCYLCPDLVIPAVRRYLRHEQSGLRPVYPVIYRIVWRCLLLQVRPHVLQARCGLPEENYQSRRFAERICLMFAI